MGNPARAVSKAFPEITAFDFPSIEEEVLAWWEERGTFRKSLEQRRGAPHFSFYEGPPTANGKPGLHHMMSRTIKDAFCRYRTMKGCLVERRAGWDTHGLPVEIEVEKELGLEGREEVEEYGIERYNAACRESVQRYTDLWDRMTVRMGYWVDLDAPYVTYTNRYIETVWWLIKEMHKKGLLFKGYKIQWYSPGSGTVLSSHEVSLGYKEVQDPSVFVRFALADEPGVSFLAWTTTPWTLISNTALAVGPDIRYARVRLTPEGASGQEELILAEDLLSVLKEAFEVVDTCTGKDLLGKAYRPVFDYFATPENRESAWRVLPADFVSTEEGTGIVHIAPAFGADDYNLGQAEGLPLINPIGPEGTFESELPLVGGMWFKDADRYVVRDLRDRGVLYCQDSYVHNYPHDWRKGTPLISYPMESWFIRTSAHKDKLIELNRQINWQPASIGAGRFGRWLENNVDWALSRRRYWATPLPIWQSDAPDSEYFEVIGSIAELREKCGDAVPDDDALDLHRPFVDTLTWDAPDGGTMRRVLDLVDVWFDSGAMPFAQWHYPFENKEQFEANFPADFIAEGVDQTRGWFYTLHAISSLVMGTPAFKNVVVNGLLLDENGEKMSKSKGNAVEPFDVMTKYGADPVRWFMMSNSPPWENIRWTDRGLRDTQRKFFSTLSNTYNFFATYANIDGFRYKEAPVDLDRRAELDRWIISRLNTTIEAVDDAYDTYNATRAARLVEQFLDDLSNWYVRRSRRRFWKSGHGVDKTAAYQTVFECLIGMAKLMAPIAPMYAEWLYRALNGSTGLEETESVHLSLFPECRKEAQDKDLELRMQIARTVSSVVLSLRNQMKINVRQPLSRILVVTGGLVDEAHVEAVRDIILDEVNIKDIEYVATSSGVVHKSAKPNFKVLGKRLGPLMKPVAASVRALDTDAVNDFEASGELVIDVEGQDPVVLGIDDVEIHSEGIEGWLVGQEQGVTVALDVHIDDDLRGEGLAREFVNRVQKMRKDAGFEVVDRIEIRFSGTELLTNSVAANGRWIRNETLANELEATEDPVGDHQASHDIDGERVDIALTKSADSQPARSKSGRDSS